MIADPELVSDNVCGDLIVDGDALAEVLLTVDTAHRNRCTANAPPAASLVDRESA